MITSLYFSYPHLYSHVIPLKCAELASWLHNPWCFSLLSKNPRFLILPLPSSVIFCWNFGLAEKSFDQIEILARRTRFEALNFLIQKSTSSKMGFFCQVILSRDRDFMRGKCYQTWSFGLYILSLITCYLNVFKLVIVDVCFIDCVDARRFLRFHFSLDDVTVKVWH